MNRNLALVVALLVAGCGEDADGPDDPVDGAAGETAGTSEPSPHFESVSFYGPVTQQEVYFGLHLPRSYFSESRRYPVVYFFHGKGWGAWEGPIPPHSLAALSFQRMMDDGLIDDFIHITVNGKVDSFFADSASNPDLQIETNLIQEVIPYVEANYRVIPQREGRATVGFSMGANGAFVNHVKYPEIFGSTVALDGGYRTWDWMVTAHPEVTLKMFDDNPENFEPFSSFHVIAENHERLVDLANILLLEGKLPDDPLVALLDQYGIPYRHGALGKDHVLAEVLPDQEQPIAEFLSKNMIFE